MKKFSRHKIGFCSKKLFLSASNREWSRHEIDCLFDSFGGVNAYDIITFSIQTHAINYALICTMHISRRNGVYWVWHSFAFSIRTRRDPSQLDAFRHAFPTCWFFLADNKSQLIRASSCRINRTRRRNFQSHPWTHLFTYVWISFRWIDVELLWFIDNNHKPQFFNRHI